MIVPKRSIGNEQHIRLSKEKAKRQESGGTLSFEKQSITYIFMLFSHIYLYLVCMYPHMHVYMCWIRMRRTSEINIVIKDLKDTGMEVAIRTLFISPGTDRSLPQPQLQLLGQM